MIPLDLFLLLWNIAVIGACSRAQIDYPNEPPSRFRCCRFYTIEVSEQLK